MFIFGFLKTYLTIINFPDQLDCFLHLGALLPKVCARMMHLEAVGNSVAAQGITGPTTIGGDHKITHD